MQFPVQTTATSTTSTSTTTTTIDNNNNSNSNSNNNRYATMSAALTAQRAADETIDRRIEEIQQTLEEVFYAFKKQFGALFVGGVKTLTVSKSANIDSTVPAISSTIASSSATASSSSSANTIQSSIVSASVLSSASSSNLIPSAPIVRPQASSNEFFSL